MSTFYYNVNDIVDLTKCSFLNEMMKLKSSNKIRLHEDVFLISGFLHTWRRRRFQTCEMIRFVGLRCFFFFPFRM